MPGPKNFAAFWPEYLGAHAAPATRALHFIGSGLAVACLALFLATLDWRFLVATPIVGYAFAFAAHFTIEHNNPKTFEHPLWSLIADYRMLGLWIMGRLQLERSRAGKAI
ncbi:MAG TPA: DUF962 domain-containing protein [Stellaceae bacterium]|jgi:hypothetical protein|nr:DUF962 domain-containing protein [Stellaceae bacterium]